MTASAYVLASILSTGIWVAAGLYKMTHQDKMTGVIRAHGIPYPRLALWLAIAVELGGAILILTGTWMRVGVFLWIGFLCVATPIFHGRVFHDGQIDYPQLVQFAKNISISGGLLALLALQSASQ